MLESKKDFLPTSEQLPSSDDTPVDNEDQNFIPNFLLFLLQYIWPDRFDWFFGIDMAIYHTTGVSPKVPIVPDGFLSLGVTRRKTESGRKSYVLWEENDIVPKFALEVVSLTPGGEYDEKKEIYAKLGVLYYLIYNPYFWKREGHQPFELYRLVDSEYQLLMGEPYWLPEIGLGIGRDRLTTGGINREVLCWYNLLGERYLTPDEVNIVLNNMLQAKEAQLQAKDALLDRYRQLFGDLPLE